MSTQAHRNPPFRAEHLGSLLRPQALLDARKASSNKSDKQVADITDQSIQDAVKMQLDLGFHAITDGEYRYVVFGSLLLTVVIFRFGLDGSLTGGLNNSSKSFYSLPRPFLPLCPMHTAVTCSGVNSSRL